MAGGAQKESQARPAGQTLRVAAQLIAARRAERCDGVLECSCTSCSNAPTPAAGTTNHGQLDAVEVRMKSEGGEPPSSSSKIHSSPLTTPAATPRSGDNKRTERVEYSASGADGRSKPFASSPLVYRGDQSFLDQCSLLSLIDPDTTETSPSIEIEEMMMMRQQQHSTPTPISTPKGR